MPISSGQISAQVAQFQQQAMMQSQAAGMVSQNAGYGGGSSTIGEHITGSMVNKGSAIGAPLAMGGMALAGMDPFSAGLRGAMAGGRHLGMMGAVGGGMMAAGAIGLPLMGAQYAGGQMMAGMQQQQHLQGALGQSFQHQNQFGGTGFTSSDMGSIGSMFRGMSKQRGPGGELTSFNELTQLAANMGQMGMSQNVSNVREFQTKFKEMLSTVKEVATAFSTSLEEAQQVMVGMRQSGVFRNQGQVASQVREFAVGGNLASSEVTGMMRVGSQISRMIGGRGQAGAIGGMKAIGNVGAALQTGTLSEEDIYNATGLTGAEGRRAMATNMLQGEARFLKSGVGRRMVAALGGAGGTVNQEAIDELMMGGGMGTGRTMQRAHENLSKMGRADFIKNEGRIRGEIMKQTGGMGHIMAMRGWLEQRGLGMDDDRSLIFMQRRLGMGTDEAEQMLKMTRDLPLLMRQRETASGEADYRSEIQQMRSRTGMAGVKKKLEDAKNSIQGTLKQWGADLYEKASDSVDRMINEISGDVHQYIAHDVESISRDLFSGGGASQQRAMSRIGFGGNQKSLGGAGMQAAMFGGMSTVGMSTAMERSGGFKRFEDAGFKISSRTDAGIKQELAHIDKVTRGFRLGFGTQGGKYRNMGASQKAALLQAVSSGTAISGSGMERLASFEKFVSQSDDPEMQQLALEMSGATDEQKSRMMSDVMRGAGLKGLERGLMESPEVSAVFGQTGFRTAKEQHQAIGGAVFGGGEDAATDAKKATEKGSFGATDVLAGIGLLNPFTATTSATYLGAKHFGLFSGDEKEGATGSTKMTARQQEEAGALLMGKDTLSRSRTIFRGSDEDRQALEEKLMLEQASLLGQHKGKVESLGEDRAQFEVNKAQIASSRLLSKAAEYGGDVSKIPKDELNQLAKDTGFEDAKTMLRRAQGVEGALNQETKAARQQALERSGKRATGHLRRAEGEGGFLTEGGKARLQEKGLSTAGQSIVDKLGKSMELQAGITGSSSEEEVRAAQAPLEGAMDDLTGMSVQEKRAFAERTSGMAGLEGIRGSALRQAGIQQRLARYGTRGALGRGIGMARELGVDLSRDDRAQLGKMTTEEQSNLIAGKLGAGLAPDKQKELQEQITAAMKSAKEGKMGEAAKDVEDLQGSKLVQEARENQQNERAKRDDPSYRALEDIKGLLSKELTVTVKGGTITTVDGSGKENPEGKGKGDG